MLAGSAPACAWHGMLDTRDSVLVPRFSAGRMPSGSLKTGWVLARSRYAQNEVALREAVENRGLHGFHPGPNRPISLRGSVVLEPTNRTGSPKTAFLVSRAPGVRRIKKVSSRVDVGAEGSILPAVGSSNEART